MFRYSFINHPSFTIDLLRVDHIFALVGERVGAPEWGVINIAFVDDDVIRSLNHRHRMKDSVTDVLSFHYYEDFSDISMDDIAWEIVMSESKILSQAEEHGHSQREEFEILLVHSLLHIFWYDHETEAEYEAMWHHEEKLRELLGLSTER